MFTHCAEHRLGALVHGKGSYVVARALKARLFSGSSSSGGRGCRCGAPEFFFSDGRRAALVVFFERQRQLEEKLVSAIDEHGRPRADARIDTVTAALFQLLFAAGFRT